LALLAFGRRTSARPELAALFPDAATLAAEVLAADLAAISEVLPDAATLLRKVLELGDEGVAEVCATREIALAPNTSLDGWALSQACAIASDDLSAEQRFRDPFLVALGVSSALAVPIPVGEQPFGTLAILSKQPRSFGVEDVQFAETVAHLLAAAVGRLVA
jgi:GAF domain-containing protein